MKSYKEQYESLIPSWCCLKTLEEHYDHLLLCWGIAADVSDGKTDIERSCQFNCEYSKDFSEEELNKLIKEA